MIEHINQYGDQIRLNVNLECHALFKELAQFDTSWSQYNVLKPWISRQGLCVLNERGLIGPGPALNSLYEWNRTYNTELTEMDFNKPTEVYRASEQVRSVLKDILPYCIRTHFLKLLPGGYFPPHRDYVGKQQKTFRLIIPIKSCNPPDTRFMIEDKTLYWNQGSMYAVNTTKEHTLFNASAHTNSVWLVINAIICEETINFVSNNLTIT
jgi:aspartyl/asparaginyl beta-hydroxylase (cupin superfamily)